MSDVRPFLTVVGTASPFGDAAGRGQAPTVVQTATRELASSLPAIAFSPAPSPWSPEPKPTAVGVAAPGIDVEAVRAEARDRGRAEGLRETAELRARLTESVAALAAARAAYAAPIAELAADIAACIIETWAASADRKAVFEPIVQAWLARSTEGNAIARVHPDDVAAVTAAISEAPITVAADPAIARGELHIRSSTLELRHSLTARLDELRVAVVAAIEGSR